MTRNKREEFEKFYLLEHDNLISEIECRIHNVVLSEEILHQGIFKCITGFSRWCGNEKLTFEYVMKICDEIIAEMELENQLIINGSAVAADPLDVILSVEKLEGLVELIDNLQPYSSVLKLHLFENFTVGEIASILNMKPNTVSKQIGRGMIKLKTAINKSKHFRL